MAEIVIQGVMRGVAETTAAGENNPPTIINIIPTYLHVSSLMKFNQLVILADIFPRWAREFYTDVYRSANPMLLKFSLF